MPLVLEPEHTFKVVLESDKEKPEDKRPYFEFPYLSGRKWKEIARKAQAVRKSKTGEEAIDAVFELIRIGLVGWGNMTDPKTGKEIPFDKKELDSILTLKEANELLVKFRNQDVEAADLKN